MLACVRVSVGVAVLRGSTKRGLGSLTAHSSRGGCSKIGSEGNGTRATLGLVAAHPCMLRMLLRSKQSSTESAHACCICPTIDRYVLSHRSLVDDYCMCMLQEGVRGTLHVM